MVNIFGVWRELIPHVGGIVIYQVTSKTSCFVVAHSRKGLSMVSDRDEVLVSGGLEYLAARLSNVNFIPSDPLSHKVR